VIYLQYNTNQIYNARKVTPKCESEARKCESEAQALIANYVMLKHVPQF